MQIVLPPSSLANGEMSIVASGDATPEVSSISETEAEDRFDTCK